MSIFVIREPICVHRSVDVARKIFIGFKNIIGYGSSLRDGFRDIGEDAFFYLMYKDKYDRGTTDRDGFLDIFRTISPSQEITLKDGICNWLVSLFLNMVAVCSLFLFILLMPFRFNTFIFISAEWWHKYMYWWLKRFDTKVIVIFFGSEVRPAIIDGVWLNSGYSDKEITDIMKKQKKLVDVVELYADCIISHPPISKYQTRPFYQYMKVGIPTPINKTGMKIPQKCDGVIKVVHSPTVPKAKGTSEIRKTIEKLISNGHKILYIEICNSAHNNVIREMVDADIIIDQMYSDIPTSGTTIDGAVNGVPVVSGSYYNFNEYDMVSGVDYPSCVICNPYNIQCEIEHLISDFEYRRKIGDDAFDFVYSRWKPRDIAENYISIIEGVADNSWIYIPSSNNQHYGCGINV